MLCWCWKKTSEAARDAAGVIVPYPQNADCCCRCSKGIDGVHAHGIDKLNRMALSVIMLEKHLSDWHEVDLFTSVLQQTNKQRK